MSRMSTMHDLHLASLDLNLLVALDALLEERSVTRAAERVGITQSAMSHSLARLRAVTGDELLVRVSRGMVPTLRAETLAVPVRRALDLVAVILRSPKAFDPKTAAETIRIATSDFGEITLLPKVVRELAGRAPGIDLRVAAYSENAAALLGSGMADLVIAPVAAHDETSGIFAKKLFDETFVCVVRNGHPLARTKLTLSRYAAASHALISPRGREGSFADDALARLGLARRVAVTVPHFLVAPHIVAGSDLVLTVASRIASTLAKPLGLAVLRPPPELRLEGFRMSMLWHERTHADPGQAWLRELFAEVARAS
jgi:DNA-binding transcriptional LysR family regulator